MSDYLRIRISSDLKEDAEAIFSDMGMTISEAVRIFIQQAVNCGGLPFMPRSKRPNEETLRSFIEAQEGNTTKFSLDDFKKYVKSVKDEA